ncbi:MAG TPA: DUF2341 domain-containing protein, partial [Bacillota bacterium]|nr:DUF2341 domain-containing protein [Bacillota bacterium]
LGTSFYITNNIISSNGITFAADGSKGLACQRQPGQYVIIPRNTNGVANPAVTITPPFSIEVWAFVGSTNIGNMNLISQGQANQNSGGADNTNSWAGFALGQYQDYFYFSCFCTNGLSKNSELDSSGYNTRKGFNTNQWVHVVATFDGTTEQIYTNGVLATYKTVAANAAGLTYVPDPTSPLMIGGGNVVSGGGAAGAFSGVLDEVAIYPSVLSQQSIQTHYETAYGTNAIYNNAYTNAVLADSPSLYYRFDDLQSRIGAGYPANTFPVAANYGLLGSAANGVYQPGTTPGLPGPAFPGFSSGASVGLNGFFGAVDVGGGSLPAALNPVGISPMSVVAWFKGAPADSPARFQSILGHSDSSYRLTFDNNAGSRFNPGPGPELQFANQADLWTNGWTLNDGNWHMVAGISDGTNDFLYLDGLLVKSGTNTSGINIAGSTLDLVLGGDPAYTVPGATAANPRNFDGQLAQVAFWTNALTPAQVQQVYGAAGVPPTIVQQPLSSTNNAGATVSLAVVAKGSSLTYQWYKNGTRLAGATASPLTFNPLSVNDAGSYFVVVANSYGSVTSSVAQLTVYGPPVAQSQSPSDVKVFVGTSPLLRVAVTGPQPYYYQWSKNNSPISGATASSYAPSTTATGNNTYTCTVTNAYGSVTFSPITVAVLADPSAPYPVSVLGDHPMAFFRLDEQPPNPWSTDGQTAYDYAGGLNGSYTNAYLNQAGYTVQTDSDTAAAFGSASTVDSFAGNVPQFLNFATTNGGNAQFSVEAWVNGGYGQTTNAGIVTLGYGNGGEQFNLDTGNDDKLHNFRFFVRDASGKAWLANGTNAPNDNAWHHVVGVCDQANGQIRLYVDGVLNISSAIPANSGLLSSTVPMSIGSRRSGSGPTYDSQFAGSIDEVAIYNYALSSTQVTAHYVAAGVAPRFVQQPPSAITTNQGATVVLSAAALGTAPITYQWLKDYVPLAGQTSPTLTLRNVDANLDGGSYILRAYNAYLPSGQDSLPTTLTVLAGPPSLDGDLQPLCSTNYEGTPFTYSVSVSGTSPFTYQWYKNNSPISGATGSSYTFNTTLGVSYYYVTVANKQGSVTSSTATNVGMAAVTLNPADYTYKMKIAFPGYNRGETLADLPVLVKFGTNLPGFGYPQLASATGGDLRFTDATGTRQIPHEIDEWNPDATSSVWVQVPRLAGTNDPASTNNFIWAYWGNPAATAPLAWSTNGGVWIPQTWEGLPAFDVVYHLKEGGFPYADSTLQWPALIGNAPVAGAALVGNGGTFASGNYLDAGTVNLSNAFTVSAWVKVNPGVTQIQTVWANKVGGYASAGFGLFINSWNTGDGRIHLETGTGSAGQEATSATGVLSFGQWHLLSATLNQGDGTSSGTARLYVDGVDVTGSSSIRNDFPTSNDVSLGHFNDGAYPFNGQLDEVRIQSGTNSASYIWASYMTVAQNATFQNYAPISSSAVTITCRVLNGNLVLSWPQGTLQVADQVNGTYNDVTTATSPYSVPLTATQKFYRIKVR